MSTFPNPYCKALTWIGVLFILAIQTISAQPFGIRKYTINDGLPDAYVLNIFQDSNGFLWLGTGNGLSRFDGKEFVNYGFADGLPDVYVNNIIEDHQRRLWIGTQKGMVEMKGDRFINYPYDDGKKIGYVFSLLETRSGQIWGLTDQGIYQFEIDHWKKISIYPGLENHHCRNIVEIPDGMIINYGDYLVRKTGNHPPEIIASDTTNWPRYNVISKHKDQVFISTDKGLFLFDQGPEHALFNNYLWNKKILSFFIDQQERYWLSTLQDGLVVSYPGDTSRIAQKIPLEINLVSQVYQDKYGIIWIASGNGLMRAEHRNFVIYDSLNHQKMNQLSNLVTTPDKVLGISGSGGVIQFGQQVPVSYLPPVNRETWSLFGKSFIDGYCSDPEGRIWIITRHGKLFTLKNEEIREEYAGSMGVYGGFFDIGYNGKTGRIYISSDTLYENGQGAFKKFTASNNGQNIVFPIKLHAFPNGLTLVNTRYEGIKMIDTLQRVFPYNSILHIPENSSLVNFYEEPSGKFWISFSGGIRRYHWNAANVPEEEIMIDEKNGLPNNSVYSMAFDDQGRMWASTASGIVTIQFDSSGQKYFIRKWNDADGINPENLRDGHIYADKSGNIWVQLTDRVYKFYPSRIQLNDDAPAVVISNIQLNLQQTNWNQWTDSLSSYLQIPVNPVLPHNRNSLGIYYKGISFRDYSGLEYSYQLLGESNSWSPPQKSNFVSFVGLPPGKYQFLVKVKDSNARWSKPVSFSFVILKPFWQLWWFIALLMLMIGYLIFTLFQFRLHEKLTVLNIRQKLHRDLHDDIGATLSSIKLYTEVLQEDPENQFIIELIKENAVEMISQLELIAWATNPQNDSFKSLSDLMKKYAIPSCYAKKIELKFQTESINPQLIIPGNIRKNIFLVFKEAINNVLKYSEASGCEAEIFIRHHRFIMHIADNGRGMDTGKHGKGSGMQNMTKRSEELNGTIEVRSKPGEGLSITLSIPYPFKIPYTWDRKGKDYQ